MSRLILAFVMVLSAASVSLAECPFKNMSANARVGLFDQSSNAYYAQNQASTSVQFAQPVKRQK